MEVIIADKQVLFGRGRNLIKFKFQSNYINPIENKMLTITAV